ncbi:MAG: hypothetical protein HC913_10080 [Microscillaceae bacterium]|nr:hypothetical protein [Microscillaceae bacterium]
MVCEEPTTFYLFSDGYPDQFGGPEGRKFMLKRLKELFLEMHRLPMDTQAEILNQALQNWMGNERQIDDILVMGFRLG